MLLRLQGTGRGGPHLGEQQVQAALGRDQAGKDVSHLTWLSQTPSRSLSLCLLPQSRDRKMVGDMTGARSYASTARSLNIAALVLGVVLTIVVIAVYASTIGFIFFQIKSQQRGYS